MQPTAPADTAANLDLIRLNKDIAVSPRMYKAILHACRILNMPLDTYLYLHLEAEIIALKHENKSNVKTKRDQV